MHPGRPILNRCGIAHAPARRAPSAARKIASNSLFPKNNLREVRATERTPIFPQNDRPAKIVMAFAWYISNRRGFDGNPPGYRLTNATHGDDTSKLP
jgi:hypothetical protein